jgi:hypothetical protein
MCVFVCVWLCLRMCLCVCSSYHALHIVYCALHNAHCRFAVGRKRDLGKRDMRYFAFEAPRDTSLTVCFCEFC